MKKALIFALTLLMCLPMVACDLSGGLVGELMDALGQGNVEDMPAVDYAPGYDDDYHGAIPVEPDIEYTEISTEIWIETDMDYPITEPPVVEPVAMYVSIDVIDRVCPVENGTVTKNVFTNANGGDCNVPGYVYEQDVVLCYGGWIAMTGVEGMTFGYSFEKDAEPVYDAAFTREATDKEQAEAERWGGTFAASYYVMIPAKELRPGSQRVYLWAYDEQSGYTYRFCELEVMLLEGGE